MEPKFEFYSHEETWPYAHKVMARARGVGPDPELTPGILPRLGTLPAQEEFKRLQVLTRAQALRLSHQAARINSGRPASR